MKNRQVSMGCGASVLVGIAFLGCDSVMTHQGADVQAGIRGIRRAQDTGDTVGESALTGARASAGSASVPTGQERGKSAAKPNSSDALSSPPFDWVGVIGTGQSLSTGYRGDNIVSTNQPFHNLKLLDSETWSAYPKDGSGTYSLVPLIEPIRGTIAGKGPGYDDGQYPNNISGETPHAGMANEMTALWKARGGADYQSVHSVVGWAGHELNCINKSGGKNGGQCHDGNRIVTATTAYAGSLTEARSIKKLADAAGKTFGYGAITLTHGESDSQNPNYATGLYELWQDYNADLRAITGQTATVPILASQESAFYAGPNGSPVQVLQAGNDHPGAIICTGPKYQFEYFWDHIHLPASGYVALGEKYGEVFDAVVNQKINWQPLKPMSASLEGAVITVAFHVPNPPLAWEESLTAPHQTVHSEWKNGRGFEVTDGAGQALTLGSVAIAGESVVLTLDHAPATAQGLVVAYAITQDEDGYQGGLPGGLHGQLRDSDPVIGYDAETIPAFVQYGSSVVQSATPRGFAARSGHDIVSGEGLANGAVVASPSAEDKLTLTAPWMGPSGTANIAIHHDLRNYAVHFAEPVRSSH